MNLLTVFTTERSTLNLTYAEVLSPHIFFLFPLVVAINTRGSIIAVWLTITVIFVYAQETGFYTHLFLEKKRGLLVMVSPLA